MSFAYLPLYTGDYLRDTRHLSMSEHGCYLMLLMFCWDQKGPLPLDERKILGVCNARSGDEIEAMRRVISEFFVRMDDGFYNKRMQEEIERAENVSAARSQAGRRGYEARAKQLPSNCQAIAKQVHLSPPPTLTSALSPSSEVKSSLSGKPDLMPQVREVLQFLRNMTGRNYREVPPTVKLITARLKNTPIADIKRMLAYKGNQWLNDPKMEPYLRPATLFSATNFEQYLAEALVDEQN
jgi:uncharacterized phage protein (TIGR02220 family)